MLAGMLAVLSAIAQEEVAGRPEWEAAWAPVERMGWLVLAGLALLNGAAWN
jgi:hypothetical protein